MLQNLRQESQFSVRRFILKGIFLIDGAPHKAQLVIGNSLIGITSNLVNKLND